MRGVRGLLRIRRRRSRSRERAGGVGVDDGRDEKVMMLELLALLLCL